MIYKFIQLFTMKVNLSFIHYGIEIKTGILSINFSWTELVRISILIPVTHDTYHGLYVVKNHFE